MEMLSRVAERVFWMARYLERAECTARVVNVLSQLRMDLPKGTELPWSTLLDVFGTDHLPDSLKNNQGEYAVLSYIMARTGNPSSIRSSIKAARENARTTRGILPEELWELINELNLFVLESTEKSINRRNRFEFLSEIITRCQTLSGFLMTTHIRDHTYKFIIFGHLLERLDITARVVNTVSKAIDSRNGSNPAFDALIWAGLLDSVSALGAYRQSIGPMVDSDSAINFIVLNPDLPRSIVYCLNTIRMAIKSLKNSEKVIGPIDYGLKRLYYFDSEEMKSQETRRCLADLQDCGERLTMNATNTWFLPSVP